MKFLEINGKNLEEFYSYGGNKDLNLSIAKLCPNLKKLFVIFNKDEIGILRDTFNGCQYLESIKIWCGGDFLNEKKVLEVVAVNSQKNFYELKIYNDSDSELLSEDLESFFVSWKDRIPRKSLSLIIIEGFYRTLEKDENNMKMIQKYKSLGVIKKFEIKDFEKDYEENLNTSY